LTDQKGRSAATGATGRIPARNGYRLSGDNVADARTVSCRRLFSDVCRQMQKALFRNTMFERAHRSD